MLELPGLLLGPWMPPGKPRGAGRHTPLASTRAVFDPSSRCRVGLVRRRSSPWPRWLGRETLEVYETDDESLLCTVRAPWWLTWTWEVFDAEERRVAIVRGPVILDGFAHPLAVVRRGKEGEASCFLTADGMELGEWIVTGEEMLLQFSPVVASQPFAKMALLGMLLSQG